MQFKGVTVAVGLSGGVDSAVAAARLLHAGARVFGVFAKGWYPPGMPCTWSEDRRDAMRVAARLRIPFFTIDASDAYKRGVIDYLVSEYRAGRTPNPDVMCNREVKFGTLYARARSLGARYFATGHYARIEHGADGPRLCRGASASKDQSYFLWAMNKDALAHTLFPLGDLEKPFVRRLASRMRLPNAAKPDSQGICFLGEISVDEYLLREFGSEPGRAVDESGERVGTHDGAVRVTIGERAKLTGAAPGPWFVVAKDMDTNELVVSKSRVPASQKPQVWQITEVNWLAEPDGARAYDAQYRYHGPIVPVRVSGDDVHFLESPKESIAPGQSLALYEGDRLMGGGILSNTV